MKFKNSTEQIATQQTLARSADYMLEPGQDFPSEEMSSMSSVVASATASGIISATTKVASDVESSTDAIKGSKHGSLRTGEVAAIVVGVATFLVIGAAILIWHLMSKKVQPEHESTHWEQATWLLDSHALDLVTATHLCLDDVLCTHDLYILGISWFVLLYLGWCDKRTT